MFAKRSVRRAAGVAAATAGLVAMAMPSATAASAGDHGWGGGRERTFELTLTRTGGADLPANPVAGDVFTEFGTAVLTRTGQPYGTWGYQGVVTAVDGGTLEEQETGVFDTPYGQITAQGMNSRANGEDAITGGTRSFRRASGWVTLDPTGETVMVHVFVP
ncbi:hypothetical protein AB0C59_08005 [Streptomyces sp. NPDC048664]|uniref:hypothetical protein n=1 Tax=Streptomyces sp. NPDC048664 TaxID=3154505 RepID=UPI00341D2072